jgi:pSer/pThr/pTyr-binding forkhead associated (FHA) protein
MTRQTAEPPTVPTTSYALRFISGKYQGGEFPLRMDREIIVGRSSELDMVLVEDMVSRKHAKITTSGDQIIIQDLGSTNGTFVNGEKIKKVRLKEGDRILIGTSIIKLVAVDAAQVVTEGEARQRLEATGQRRNVSGANKPMSGSIDEIPLPDLLQLLSTSRKSGVLSVRGEGGHGRIYLRKGQIYYSTIDDSYDLSPRKAAFRMLTWMTGTFELEPPDEKSVLEEIQDSTEALLMEGMRQLDEYRRIEPDLPAREDGVGVAAPLQAALRDLQPNELDTLQLVINYGQFQAVLDRSPRTDLETAQTLLTLIQRDYVTVRR